MKPKVQHKKYKVKNPIQDAIEYGIDVTLLYESLSLTPTERLENNLNLLKAAEELRKAGERKHAKP
ncbi:MAG: hypothetical protein HY096_16140 [Nitrospinae bacterium]|nr:hypothetical protein [Nitrospinota bacterium]MBI5749052.1 hypothetical protein [Nitrospinota bacterium]